MIAFFELENGEEAMVKATFPDAMCFDEPLKQQHLAALKDCDVLAMFIYSKITAQVLEQLPNLKLVATMSTGYDHIDLAACKSRGVIVCNVPSYGDHTVAQHTFALILGITRKIVQSVKQVQHGNFSPSKELRGQDIHDKTIGVVGTGKIGMNVVNIARGFDMSVLAYDPRPNEQAAQQRGFSYVSLDELFTKSDIITLHVPLLATTRHLINEEAIGKMRHGVMIINTSRGGIIDTQALYDGLVSGKVAAAGLDVLEEETNIKEEKQLLSQQFQKDVDYKTMLMNHLLAQHPSVLVTPHNAFNSTEALQRIINTTIQNIQAFRAGKPQNVIQ